MEFHSGIIDSSTLLDRVRHDVLKKGIDIDNYAKKTNKNQTHLSNLQVIEKNMTSIYGNIEVMNNTWMIEEQNCKIEGCDLNSRLKRKIRKLSFRIMRSYWIQQRDLNGAVTRAISDMVKVQESLIALLKNTREI